MKQETIETLIGATMISLLVAVFGVAVVQQPLLTLALFGFSFLTCCFLSLPSDD